MMPDDATADDTTTAPEAPPAAPDYGADIRELRAELGREREQRAALEGTLRVLGAASGGATQQAAPALVRLPGDAARRIAQQLGGQWNEEQVQAHAPIFAAFMAEIAAPLLVGIEGMADTVDLLQVRQEVPTYETIAEEADRVRTEYRSRGQMVTRKQAVALVKARRMDDPKHLDQMLSDREKQRDADRTSRAASAAAATSEGGTTLQKVGPEPTKGPRSPLTPEEFARLPLEEKRKAIGDMNI
jgi:hypothetical protein